MKVYCQLKVLSTGYVSRSIPPVFKIELISPVDKLGSEGVIILDGRLNLSNHIENCKKYLKKDIVGFDIVKSEKFTNKGLILYRYE